MKVLASMIIEIKLTHTKGNVISALLPEHLVNIQSAPDLGYYTHDFNLENSHDILTSREIRSSFGYE